jgi:hypothetical protein
MSVTSVDVERVAAAPTGTASPGADLVVVDLVAALRTLRVAVDEVLPPVVATRRTGSVERSSSTSAEQ